MARKEQGYALVLVMFMIVIFMILGTAVLSASIGGATRTEKREDDIQSLHLAGKTLDEAAAYLVSQFDGRTDITPEDLEFQMSESQREIIRQKMKADTEFENASGEITGFTAEQRPEGNNTRYLVTLTAEATVNNTTRQLQQELIIHCYPDFMKFAFGSEANVILNGSLQGLNGSVYAGEELRIDNNAKYRHSSREITDEMQSHPTIYPVLNLDEEDYIYVQKLDNIKYNDGTGYVPFSGKIDIAELLGDGITNEKVRIQNHKKFVSIDVEETFADKVEEAAGIGYTRDDIDAAIASGNFSSLGITQLDPPPSEPGNPDSIEEVEDYDDAKEAYINQFINLSDSVFFDGDLEIDGIDLKSLEFDGDENERKGKWLIVDGDLNIINSNPDSREWILIKANILVTGKVRIKGKVKVDSAIYTMEESTASGGPTTILEDATIRGIEVAGDSRVRKQLILISRGEILINRVDALDLRNDAYSESNPNTLDAFFYTEASAELYGVGSIFWLHGGFFAKGDLTINAVRGAEVREGTNDFIFEAQTELRVPRFVIDYYNDFYELQYSGLPRVEQLSVEMKGRRLVN